MLYVYKIIHAASGRAYVGMTSVGARKRWYRHVRAAQTGTTPIAKAIRDHGAGAFRLEIIEAVSTYEIAIARETYWIAEHKKLPSGVYNIFRSGGGSSASDKTRAAKEPPRSVGEKFRLRRAKKSGPHIKAKPELQPRSIETRAKLRAANLGKTLSEEHRAKLSAAKRGKKRQPLSSETRAKIGAAHRGKKLSAEHRAKVSVAGRIRWARIKAIKSEPTSRLELLSVGLGWPTAPRIRELQS